MDNIMTNLNKVSARLSEEHSSAIKAYPTRLEFTFSAMIRLMN